MAKNLIKKIGVVVGLVGALAGTAYAISPEQRALDYVGRNGIDLSVLEAGEKPVELYIMGDSDENKLVITNKALSKVVEVNDLIQELNSKKIKAWQRDSKKGIMRDPFADMDQTAENVEKVITAMDAGYNCSEPQGKTDHLITGREVEASYKCVTNYLKRLIGEVK